MCYHTMRMKQLILASRSPRRRELLEKCGIPFVCIPADLDETIDESNDLSEEIMKLSRRKAEAVLAGHRDAVVIGSDTIVVCDETVLQKPLDRADAVRMLTMLSGRTHQVITGICIVSDKRLYTDVSVSDVTFGIMSNEDIAAYAATGECDDKAGAYAVQGYGGRYIEQIRGDYYAIMGLPLFQVYRELKNYDLY